MTGFPAIKFIKSRVQRWFVSPVFVGDEIKTRRAELTNAIIITTAVLIVLLFIGNMLEGRLSPATQIVNVMSFVACVVMYLIMRRGRVEFAGGGIIVLGIIFLTAGIVSLGTIRTPSTVIYLLIVILSGLLFEYRAVLVTIAFCSLAVLGVIVAETMGILSAPDYTVHITQWITYTLLFILSGSFTLFVTHVTKKAFVRAENELAERKQVEDALRQSETHYRHISSTISDIAYSCLSDADGFFIDWLSGAVEPITGYTAEELKALRCWGHLVVDDDFYMFEQSVIGVAPGGTGSCELRILHKDGSIRWINSYTECAGEENGHRLYGALVDITERKLVEEKLRESEDLFKYVFDYSMVGMSITKLSGETRVNKAFCTTIGYSLEEFGNRKWQEITHPDDIDLTQREIDAILSGEKISTRFTKRFIHRNGSVVWVDLSSSLRRDKDGKPLYLVTVLVDVTERKRAEEALIRSKEFIQSINNNLVSGMVYQVLRMKDGSRKFTYLSDAVQHLYGISPRQGMEDPDLVYGRVYKDDRLRVFQEEEEAYRTFSVFKTETRMMNPDGSIRWSSFVSNPKLLDDETTCWDGIELDITERKQAEDALMQSEAQYHLLADNMTDVIWLRDLNLNLLYVSPSGEKLWGYTLAELQQFPFEEFLTPDSVQAAMEVFTTEVPKVIADPTYSPVITREFEFYARDGSLHSVESKLSIVRDENGTPIAILGQDRNITERKQMEEALRESEQKFRSVVQESMDGFALVNEQGLIAEWNPGMERTSGLSREQVIGKPQWEVQALLAPQDKNPPDYYRELFEKVLRTGEAPFLNHILEVNYVDKDGRQRTARQVVYSVKTPRGFCIATTSHDITDRKRMEEALRESEKELKEIFDNSLDNIFVMDVCADGRFKVGKINSALEKVFNTDKSNIEGNYLDQILDKNSVDLITRHFLECIETKKNLRYEESADLPDGIRNYSTNLVPILDEKSNVARFIGVSRDITERKRMEDALRESREMYRLLAENISDVIWIYDVNDGRTSYISPSVERLRGYTAEEVMTKKMSESLTPASLQFVQHEMNSRVKAFQDGYRGFYMDELEQPCKDGSTVWTETTTSFHLNETNGHLEMYGVSRDITERRRSKKLLEEVNEQLRFHVTEIEQLQTELREQAIRDPLTGLYNRRYMQDAFAREFSRAMRENYPISVIMLDMDGLKAVNDMYGHHIGDRAIQTLASCLQTMIRAEDIVCRYGGDEFTVIMSRTGKDDALKRVHEWRIFLAEHPMAIDSENKIEIKFTAGLASFPVHGFTMEEMIHYTDVALYRAKARGRNCTEVFE